MHKPKQLEIQSGELPIGGYIDGMQTVVMQPPTRKEFIELLESHNNLVEVVNYILEEVQALHPGLLDIEEE